MEADYAFMQQQNSVLSFIFYFFSKNSEHCVCFLVITELRATLKFLTRFSGLIPECNDLLFPVTELKIGNFKNFFYSYLFYFILNFVCCFIACLGILLQSFKVVSKWIILYHLLAFSRHCLSHFHTVREYYEQNWTWQTTFASCLLNQFCVGSSILPVLAWLLSLHGIGQGAWEQNFVTQKALTVGLLYF